MFSIECLHCYQYFSRIFRVMVIKNTIQLVNSDFFGAFVEKENILRGDIFISSATCPLSALARGWVICFYVKKNKQQKNKTKQTKAKQK